ncbi:hypothetical protein G3N55_02025 [Dissulfurirhabdus thermomarina]|uniref:Uncharacterized protein n=1 Tax=Dissulfurirhabdus thermomarina TaxID=1765737 RepID=A0A6N9TMG1_DISTH|nr:hypothetical protein [Dissulfurirhabdus thermomarina]NDY41630.1 hypothetical protein [Dissulfurirhabdus thermomarina]NMX23327.1 hypothetical protein [Dissulfurirhabdus thermomarina]
MHHDDGERRPSAAPDEETELLSIRIRKDLYRAFRRCAWMTVHETGLTLDEVHNRLVEDLLRARGC